MQTAQKTEETKVVFRMWRGDLIALFPDMKEQIFGMVGSFMHVGQHGMADYMGIMKQSKPATPEEYADLKQELEKAPYFYKLKIRRRR